MDDKKKFEAAFGGLEDLLNNTELNVAFKEMQQIIPQLAKMHLQMYNAMKEQGYTEAQAFQFTCDWLITLTAGH